MNQLFSEKFRSARILKGWSLQDLANKLNNQITRQALHKYEKGIVIPDSNRIAVLAEVLEVNPDFFFKEIKIELGPIEFRKISNLPSKEESRIIEQVRDQLSRYLELEKTLGIQGKFNNPINKDFIVNSLNDIEEAVDIVRREWKLGTDPITNCIELLENNHIKVIAVESDEVFDGMQTWVNNDIPVIAINVARIKPSDRKRFTVLHELAHLLIPSINELPVKQKEKICHQFAAAMLLPKETAIKELGNNRTKILIQELGTIKRQYGISIQAIVMRAKDLRIITESYYKQFFFFINQMGWRTEEPDSYNYQGLEQSNRFQQLLFRALAEEIITIPKAASLLNQSITEFKEKALQVA